MFGSKAFSLNGTAYDAHICALAPQARVVDVPKSGEIRPALTKLDRCSHPPPLAHAIAHTNPQLNPLLDTHVKEQGSLN
jgi:hypothetical protein